MLGQKAKELPTNLQYRRPKGQFGFVCAFGLPGKFDEPTAAPTTKGAFVDPIQTKAQGIGFIQQRLQSYQHEINS